MIKLFSLKSLASVAMTFCSAACLFAQGHPQVPKEPVANPWAHDPSIVQQGDTVYVFTTGHGITQMHSTDLKMWSYDGPCLNALPDWVLHELPKANMHIWAPDVVFHNGEWHLFYCVSYFGKNSSVIGHATSKTLNRNSPAFGWKDCGMIVRSWPGRDNWNAIDPAVSFDEDGHPWVSFGSFWGGIKMVRLADDLGGLAFPEHWSTIATRVIPSPADEKEAGSKAIEAPFIFRHGEWYYLFTSWDYCCRGAESTYHVTVGRSKNIEGPYLDKDGKELRRGGGSEVYRADGVEYVAGGHCSVANVLGKDRMALHIYSASDGRAFLSVRDIEWTIDGWPVLK